MITAFGPRLLFVCYERIFHEPEVELARITGFLGLPKEATKQIMAQLERRSNPGRYPRFLGGWLFGARLLSGLERARYAPDLGGGGLSSRLRAGLYWFKIAVMAVFATGCRRSAPKLPEGTGRELSAFFAETNRGLDDRTGVPFHRYWQVE